MADVKLNWGSNPGQTFKVEYKKTSNTTWILAVNGLVPNTYTVTALDAGVSYDFRVSSICVTGTCIGTPVTVTTTTGIVTIWIEDTFTCEQSNPLTLGDTYTGFSSPFGLFYDDTTKRMYVIDADDTGGNLWYFDPATMAGTTSRVYVPGSIVTNGMIQSWDVVPELRKIYIAGPYTSGVMVYDIAANTLNTVTTGSNASFARLLTVNLNGTIYSSNAPDGTLVLIDPNTDTILSTVTVSTIPSNTSNKYFNGAYRMFSINGEIWVTAAQRLISGNIARYDSTLTTFLGEIVIPGVMIPTGSGWGSNYWQGAYYDKDKNKFYLHDIGSSTSTIIDTTTNTIINQYPMTNAEGKAHVNIGWSINQLTGQLFTSRLNLDSPSDGSQITRFYVTDRDTYEFKSMYLNQTVGNLTLRSGTNQFWACDPALHVWDGGIAWSTDGKIFKYTT